jgi:hypothetical protein
MESFKLLIKQQEPLSVIATTYQQGQDGGVAVSPRGSSAVFVMVKGAGVPAIKQGNRAAQKGT